MEHSLLTQCVFEFLGTFVLLLLGNGVVANTILNKTKGFNGGWVVITMGWGFGVMCGVFIAGSVSGAHLNPVVSLGFAIAGKMAWSAVPGYVLAQMLGGFAGALVVYAMYKDHYDVTEDQATKLSTFATIPNIEGHKLRNLFTEAVGTWLLVFVILVFGCQGNTACMEVDGGSVAIGLGSIGAFPVTALIMAIGMSLGGATGYAINPARDLGPRIAHAILPIKGKGSSRWDYSWVPVLGPTIGAILAALMYIALY